MTSLVPLSKNSCGSIKKYTPLCCEIITEESRLFWLPISCPAERPVMATFQPSAPSSRHTEKYVAVVRNSSFRYDNLQRETNRFFSLKNTTITMCIHMVLEKIWRLLWKLIIYLFGERRTFGVSIKTLDQYFCYRLDQFFYNSWFTFKKALHTVNL